MKDVMRSSSIAGSNQESVRTKPLSRALSNLAGWVFAVNADRWRRRAQFYERHRDYFPRMASGPFVDRCRQLESASREVACMLFALPQQDEMVPVRIAPSRVK